MTDLAEVRKRLRAYVGSIVNEQAFDSHAKDILALLDATEPKPVPAGMEERIEAARLAEAETEGCSHDTDYLCPNGHGSMVRRGGRCACGDTAESVIRAFAPGLFDGREWIAPTNWPFGGWVDTREWDRLYAIHDAYLKEQEKKP